VLAANGSFCEADVFFAPSAPAQCPGGRACGAYAGEIANVWMCGAGADCFPAGDARYGQTLAFIDAARPQDGVAAVYGGGAERYSTRVQVFCGEGGFEDVGYVDASREVVVNLMSPEACAREDGPSGSPPPPPPAETETETTADSPVGLSQVGRIVGIVVCALAAVAIVAGIAAYRICRSGRRKDEGLDIRIVNNSEVAEWEPEGDNAEPRITPL
jgi:hypothetical protein